MGVFRGIKKGLKMIVDVPRWLNAKQLSQDAVNIIGSAKRLLWITDAQRKESFAQAVARLNLTEEDIVERKKAFLRNALLFCLMAFVIFCYGIYLFWIGSLGAGFLSLIFTLVSLAFAFRYHFWFFQLKHRKLGCTLKEWYNSEIEVSDHTELATKSKSNDLEKH